MGASATPGLIDFHVHIGNLFRNRFPHAPLTAHQLVDRMNRLGIDIGVLLPCESPEAAPGYFLTEQALEARDLYPERLIAFCCVDPRMPGFTEQIDLFVTRCDCRGFGEHINSLAFDDKRNKTIYARCDEYGLPLVFEINRDYCWDDTRLSRLEGFLQEFPNVKFVGHGPGFWAAISGDYDAQGGYPTGPVTPGGPIDRLLAEYDNLYADISAHSGYNALTRDPEFTLGFVERHWRKMLFGTDIMGHSWHNLHAEWLAALPVSEEIRASIAHLTARYLLDLPQSTGSPPGHVRT